MPEEDFNKPLLYALMEAAGGADPLKRLRIYEEILKTSLLLELTKPVTDPGEGLRLIGLVSHDGRKGLATFTDEKALRMFKPTGGHSIAVAAPAIFKMALDNAFDAVLINPPGIAWEVTREEFEPLSRGEVPTTRPMPQQAMVRCEIRALGRDVPGDVVAGIRLALEPYPEVVAAYFFMMAMAHEAPTAALGFELNIPTDLFPELARRMEENGFELPDLEGLSYSCGPLTGDMLPGVLRLGTKVFTR